MKTKKKGCGGCFLIIFIILVGIVITSTKGYVSEIRRSVDEEPTKVEQVEETTKIEETKDYELDFIGVKRLKKEFGDSLLKVFISIEENNDESFTEQMRIIDDILTELELKKKVGVNKEVRELYDLFIEDIKATVEMLIAGFYGLGEYEELHKKVMELDEEFLNEFHRIENKLK
ncbi:hypothetical protein ES703_26485 [subsurface metagenome]